MPTKQLSHEQDARHTLWYAPSWSRSRRPPRTPATVARVHVGDAVDKCCVARIQSAVFLKITAKCTLLVCVSGVAWACLIIRIISPAVVTLVGPAAFAPAAVTSSGIVRRAKNTTSFSAAAGNVYIDAEHSFRFIGQKSFPERFESWAENGEVVVNGMDVEPLGSETLPKADLLMAVLSGNTKVGYTVVEVLCGTGCCCTTESNGCMHEAMKHALPRNSHRMSWVLAWPGQQENH